MKTSQISYGFLLSFITMTFMLRWSQSAMLMIITFCVILAGMFAAMRLLNRKQTISRWQWLQMGTIVLCGISIAWLNVALHPRNEAFAHLVDQLDGQLVTVHGIISRDPDRRPMQTKFTVDLSSIETAPGQTTKINGRVLATDKSQWPAYQYGDAIIVAGKIQKPTAIDDFDYPAYLRIDDIEAIMPSASIKRILTFAEREKSHDKPSLYDHVLSRLSRMKEGFEAQINTVYPEPHASLLAGLLTGSRRGIPDHLTQAFQITGLSHIIAISGYNITIILTLLSGLLFWLPIRWRTVPLAIGITLFTLLVGASASVVRAAIMGILGLIALHAGRQRSERLIVLWAAFFMIAWNPLSLWYDAGFQLSFLAVIGLMELSPWLEHKLRFIPDTFALRTSLVATIAAQIATLPVTTLIFGRISLIAPVANLLIAPLVPLAMLFGFLGTTLSFVSFPLGQYISFICFAFLHLMILVAQTLSTVPLAAISLV